jgi:hypothetical protein
MTVYLNRSKPVKLFFTFTRSGTPGTPPSAPHLSRSNRGTYICQGAGYFCFTAIAEISIRALLTRAAAWTVARAGLGSGITLL